MVLRQISVKTKKIKEINIMKVKVFICALTFLHIKEEILMKRKNYKIIIFNFLNYYNL